MGTVEQRSNWQNLLMSILTGAFIVLFTFLLARFDKKMEEFKAGQTQMIAQQVKMLEEQKQIQALLGIEYKSTDWALLMMFDGEYQEIKSCKKEELIKDYKFRNQKYKGD